MHILCRRFGWTCPLRYDMEKLSPKMDQLVNQFFETVPLRQLKWGNAWNSTALSIEKQQDLLRKTVMSPVCLEFPPSLQYRRLFVKHILKQCEEYGLEIAEEVYEVYSSLVAQPDQEQHRFYKTYKLPTGKLITVKESAQLVCGGTTGLRSWPAGQYLVEWVAENSHIIAGRRILELGSGLGLTGLAVCDLSQPATYTFSDCHEEVLKTLHENVELNIHRNNSQQNCESGRVRSDLEADYEDQGETKPLQCKLLQEHTLCDIGVWFNRTRCAMKTCMEGENKMETNIIVQQDAGQAPGMTTTVSICCIDWENIQNDWLWSLNADIILAADVTYDTRIQPSLICVLSTLLNGPDNIHRVAYIASTIRNQDSHQLFLDLIDDADMVATSMTPPQCDLFHYDRMCSIEILRLMQKR